MEKCYWKWTQDPDEGETAPECPMCHGEGVFLGELGHLTHYRCRVCGWDFNRKETEHENA